MRKVEGGSGGDSTATLAKGPGSFESSPSGGGVQLYQVGEKLPGAIGVVIQPARRPRSGWIAKSTAGQSWCTPVTSRPYQVTSLFSAAHTRRLALGTHATLAIHPLCQASNRTVPRAS